MVLIKLINELKFDKYVFWNNFFFFGKYDIFKNINMNFYVDKLYFMNVIFFLFIRLIWLCFLDKIENYIFFYENSVMV